VVVEVVRGGGGAEGLLRNLLRGSVRGVSASPTIAARHAGTAGLQSLSGAAVGGMGLDGFEGFG
jgi:hypothetical protein